MANQQKKYIIDDILPEREASYESFYEAISSSDLVRKDEEEGCYKQKARTNSNQRKK